MTLPLWGQLQKSTDDAETIEEAIARIVALHEEEPTAHLGEGESLSEHKHQSTIDHPAGSVVADKSAFTEMEMVTLFENIAGFTKSAYVTNSSWPGVSMDYYDGGRDVAYIQANMLGLLNTGDLTHSLLVDIYFHIDYETGTGKIDFSVSNSTRTQFDIGLRIDGDDVIGYARWGGSEHVTSSLYTLMSGELVNARIFYDYDGGVIYFYINGEQVGTLQPASAISSNNQFVIHCDAQTEESGFLRVYRFALSRGQ